MSRAAEMPPPQPQPRNIIGRRHPLGRPDSGPPAPTVTIGQRPSLRVGRPIAKSTVAKNRASEDRPPTA